MQFDKIKKMRNYISAPVDDMGVEWTVESGVDRKTQKFQALVSLILSAQTPDPMTYKTMTKLKNYGLTVERISKISTEDFIDLIYGVNFHNNKTKAILNVRKLI
jgi:endonuclease-3